MTQFNLTMVAKALAMAMTFAQHGKYFNKKIPPYSI
jgi:hypothetical protein